MVSRNGRAMVSNKSMQIVRTSDKIKISWSEFYGNPELNQYTLRVRYIEIVVKTHVPMLASSFEKLEKEHQDTLATYLETMYVVSLGDEKLKKYIEIQAASRYRSLKYKCHCHFLKHGPAITLQFKLRPKQWRYLVKKKLIDPKKPIISNRNRLNRSKNPKQIVHRSGPKPVCYRADKLYKAGHLAPYMQAVINEYLLDEDEEMVDIMQKAIDKFIDSRPEEEDDVVIPVADQCEIIIKTFGERRGTTV